MRNAPLLLLSCLLAAGCARNLRLPALDTKPLTTSFETGFNHRTKAFDFEVPEVKKDVQVSSGISLNLAGASLAGSGKSDQGASFAILRGGQPFLAAACRLLQQGTHVGTVDYPRHTYTCTAPGFELTVDEPQPQVFTGTARLGKVAVSLESSDDLEKGIPQRPSGFHLKVGARWVGTFEYWQGGKVFLRPDLSPAERDATLATMVAVQSTDLWLARSLEENRGGGGFAF